MTEELTEDKTKEELDEDNPLFTETLDAVGTLVCLAASPEEQQRFATELVAWAVIIAKWAGYGYATQGKLLGRKKKKNDDQD